MIEPELPDRLAEEYAVGRRQVLDHRDALIAKIAERRATPFERMRLTQLEKLLAPQRQILAYVPHGGGGIVEVIGDLAAARHVAVALPGMGARVAYADRYLLRARRLRAAAGEDTAVIAWNAHDFPQHPASARAAKNLQVVTERLVAFLRWLRRRTAPGTDVTGLFLSYSCLVGAQMLRAHRHERLLDRVVFSGPAGLGPGITTAADLGELPVFVGRAPGDPFPHFQTFGRDPSELPGARRFYVDPGLPVAVHFTGYFDEGSASLANLGHIIGGRLDQVTTATTSRYEERRLAFEVARRRAAAALRPLCSAARAGSSVG